MALLADNTSYIQLPAIPNDLGLEAHPRPVQDVQPRAQLYGPQRGDYVRLNLSFCLAFARLLSLRQSVALPDTS
jgi:hypothetical protein